MEDHKDMRQRVKMYETEIHDVKLKLQMSEQRLLKAEALNRELTAQKVQEPRNDEQPNFIPADHSLLRMQAGLESNLQSLQQEHAVLLRRESAEKDTLRRAAEVVAKEAERQVRRPPLCLCHYPIELFFAGLAAFLESAGDSFLLASTNNRSDISQAQDEQARIAKEAAKESQVSSSAGLHPASASHASSREKHLRPLRMPECCVICV